MSLQEAREKARTLMKAGAFQMRSCHECNAAHEHFTDSEDCVILCFACGKYWLGAIDLTETEEEA